MNERGPVGHWRATSGSFESVESDDIWFDANGDGRYVSSSRLAGDSTTDFRWRLLTQQSLEITPTHIDGESFDQPAEIIRYETGTTATDVATVATLTETGTSGFWRLPSPIRYIGVA